ncbi:MAG: hypothetical protein FJ098_02430 [Deltaproteobacteria bacterium]|nr:hypothetical protein [Deltaproteobacteria bacterium]
MANTKELSRSERKTAKREQRKGLKQFYAGFNREERRKFKKAPKGGLKGFKLGTNQED